MAAPDLASLLPALAGSYLLGSIPCGLLLTRAAGLGDIRSIGSGNIGATNVLRTGNKTIALLTLLGDFAKGLAAVLIVRAELEPAHAVLLGALRGEHDHRSRIVGAAQPAQDG